MRQVFYVHTFSLLVEFSLDSQAGDGAGEGEAYDEKSIGEPKIAQQIEIRTDGSEPGWTNGWEMAIDEYR